MSATGPTTRLALTPSAGACSRVRRSIHGLLEDAAAPGPAREAAVLLANELVSNAIEHGRGPAYLDAEIGPDRIRIAVADQSPEPPRPSPSVDGLDERGRGLLMIAALASRWGFDPRPGGKTVWCELDLT